MPSDLPMVRAVLSKAFHLADACLRSCFLCFAKDFFHSSRFFVLSLVLILHSYYISLVSGQFSASRDVRLSDLKKCSEFWYTSSIRIDFKISMHILRPSRYPSPVWRLHLSTPTLLVLCSFLLAAIHLLVSPVSLRDIKAQRLSVNHPTWSTIATMNYGEWHVSY